MPSNNNLLLSRTLGSQTLTVSKEVGALTRVTSLVNCSGPQVALLGPPGGCRAGRWAGAAGHRSGTPGPTARGGHGAVGWGIFQTSAVE